MAKAQALSLMDQLLEQTQTDQSLFDLGGLVEGNIIDLDAGKILVDLNGIATGIIAGRDMNDSSNSKASLQIGDRVSAIIIEEENNEGLVVLSLRKASQRKAWDRFKELFAKKELIKVKATEANRLRDTKVIYMFFKGDARFFRDVYRFFYESHIDQTHISVCNAFLCRILCVFERSNLDRVRGIYPSWRHA